MNVIIQDNTIAVLAVLFFFVSFFFMIRQRVYMSRVLPSIHLSILFMFDAAVSHFHLLFNNCILFSPLITRVLNVLSVHFVSFRFFFFDTSVLSLLLL